MKLAKLEGEENSILTRVPESDSALVLWRATPAWHEVGRYSKGNEKQGHTHWQGFQRRWAVGFQMHCSLPEQAAR